MGKRKSKKFQGRDNRLLIALGVAAFALLLLFMLQG